MCAAGGYDCSRQGCGCGWLANHVVQHSWAHGPQLDTPNNSRVRNRRQSTSLCLFEFGHSLQQAYPPATLPPSPPLPRLSKVPGVAAIKEASGSLDQSSEIASLCSLPILSGDDSLTLPLMAVGATGVVSVLSNLWPEAVVKMVRRGGQRPSLAPTIMKEGLPAPPLLFFSQHTHTHTYTHTHTLRYPTLRLPARPRQTWLRQRSGT